MLIFSQKSYFRKLLNLRIALKRNSILILVFLLSTILFITYIDLNSAVASSGPLSNEEVFDSNSIMPPILKDFYSPNAQEKAEIYVEKTVAPLAAKIGDRVQFTIEVTNIGKGHAENVIVTDPVNHLLTVNSVDSTKGTVTINPDQVRIDVGTIDPDSSVKITIITSVNQKAVLNIQVFNTAYVQYPEEGKTISRTSNTVSVLISGTATLPGTGGMEINVGDASPRFEAYIILAALFGFLGVSFLVMGFWLKTSHTHIFTWINSFGFLLVVGGVIFSLAACGTDHSEESFGEIESGEIVEHLVNTPVALKDQSKTVKSPLPTKILTPETELSPPESESASIDLNEQEPDLSQITRLVIPKLGLDNSVVYAPFDGLTWQISELGENIGWMENTSIPGLGSNTALSAHVTANDSSEGPFKHLQDLDNGDIVEVFTDEKVYTYAVTGQEIVSDTDFSIIEPTIDPQLTLITCAGWHVGLATYLDRLVVYSDLVNVQPLSDPVSSN